VDGFGGNCPWAGVINDRPKRPRVAVTMQGDTKHACLVATAAEPAGPVVGREGGQLREKRAGGRQLLQHLFQCLANCELRPRAGFHAEIGDCPALPVNVLGGHIGGVTLRRAGFPKQFQEEFPLGVFLAGKDGFLFLPRDAAPVFGVVFWPEIRGDDGNGNPAKVKGEIMQPFQKLGNGDLVMFEHGKKIVCGGFQQFLVARSIEGFGLEHAGVTLAAAVLGRDCICSMTVCHVRSTKARWP